MNFNFKGFFKRLFLFCFLSQFISTTQAQECDECSRPRIALYDFSMMVTRPAPDSQLAIERYLDLFYTGTIAKSRVRSAEPSQDCLSWWDGALINAEMLQEGRLLFGTEYTNLPPAGPLNGGDYILWGITSESGSSIQSTLLLEAAESRELVKSVIVTYPNTFEGVTAAGESLADQFGSILSVIKEFERHKRDTDKQVAIRDYWNTNSEPEIKITPSKMRVTVDEAIDISIEMIDCDGVPLGGRTIYFTDTTVNDMNFSGTTLGKIEPPVVVTDEAGRAEVKFMAGKNTGLAQINAFFPHFKPNGRTGGFIGSSAVLIGEPPDDRWLLQLTINDEYERKSDTSWTQGNQHGVYNVYERYNGAASLTGFVENGGLDTSFYAVYYDEYGYPVEDCSVSGFAAMEYYKKYVLEWEDPLPEIDIERSSHRGSASKEYAGFEFHYPTEPGDIVLSVIISGVAKGITNWTHSVYFPEREVKNESGNSSQIFSLSATFLHGECSVTRTDSAYIISGSNIIISREHQPGRGLETVTERFSVKATLRSDGTPVDVKSSMDVPRSVILNNNYPNPFNPATVISYQLPEKGDVKLKVYNLLGSEVAVLVNEVQMAGSHKVNFNAGHLPSGVYFFKLFFNNQNKTGKMLLMK